MNTVSIICPFCHQKQTITAPENQCLAFVQCQHCKKLIKATPIEGKCTCVICEYSDEKCPIEKEQ